MKQISIIENHNQRNDDNILDCMDKHGMCCMSEIVSQDVFANNPKAKALFIHSVIDHWRLILRHEAISIQKPGLFFMSIDCYKESYKMSISMKPNLIERKTFIADEIGKITQSILSLKVKRDILKTIHEWFSYNQLDNIGRIKIDAASPYTDLKDIAMLWDLIEYLVFLRHERLKLSKLKGTGLYITSIKEDKAEKMYNELVKEGFVDAATDKVVFVDFMCNRPDENQHIFWIDRAANGLVNKGTLLTFMENIAEGNVNLFLIKYFKLKQRDINRGSGSPLNIVDITAKSLKQTKKNRNSKKGVSLREKKVIEIARLASQV